MKQFAACLFLVILIVSCSPASRESTDGGVQASFADSLFRHNGQQAFRASALNADYDTATKAFRLTALSDAHRQLLTDTLYGGSPYNAFYYSRLPLVGSVLPVTVLSEVTDGSPVDLFLIGADGAVTASMKLSEGACDAAAQEGDGEQVACAERFSVFADDSTVRVTDLSFITEASGKTGSVTTRDSVVSVFRITREGLLKLLTTDSSRTRTR